MRGRGSNGPATVERVIGVEPADAHEVLGEARRLRSGPPDLMRVELRGRFGETELTRERLRDTSGGDGVGRRFMGALQRHGIVRRHHFERAPATTVAVEGLVDHERIDHGGRVCQGLDSVTDRFTGEQGEVVRRVVGDDGHPLIEQRSQRGGDLGDDLVRRPSLRSCVHGGDAVHSGRSFGNRDSGVCDP